MQPKVGQFQQPQAPLNPSQQALAPGSSSLVSSDISVGMGTSTPGNSQLPWPKMKPSDVQKYTKVFMEVDTDRDGRITGEQARNLFLSWRLPRGGLPPILLFFFSCLIPSFSLARKVSYVYILAVLRGIEAGVGFI